MKYIQALDTIVSQPNTAGGKYKGRGTRFSKDSILALQTAVYRDNILTGYLITSSGQEFYLDANQSFRILSDIESKFYQQEVVIVENGLLKPTLIEMYKNVSNKVPTINVKIGTLLYIDGYSRDAHFNSWVPYTLINGYQYELIPDTYILNIEFEDLVEKTEIGTNKWITKIKNESKDKNDIKRSSQTI